MSKISTANYPAYGSSTVSVGGSKAHTGLDNNTLISKYDMSDAESAIYGYALNTLASILPQINTFDKDTLSSIKSEVGAYKNQGIQEINDLYNSYLTNISNDSASRFGNLDNSIFADRFNDLETERSKAVSSFAQDVLAKQSGLNANELSKRYALINLLSGLSDNIYNNALNAISTSLTGSANANSYNNRLYDALSSMENLSTRSSSNNLNSLLSGLLGTSNNSNSWLNFL